MAKDDSIEALSGMLKSKAEVLKWAKKTAEEIEELKVARAEDREKIESLSKRLADLEGPKKPGNKEEKEEEPEEWW